MQRALHKSWSRYLSTSHHCGLATDLNVQWLRASLGPRTGHAATAAQWGAMVHAYYEAHGNILRARHRQRADGYASMRRGEDVDARGWLERLVHAIPHLSHTRLVQVPELGIARGPKFVTLPSRGSSLELADVVDAMNLLLRDLSQSRLVALATPPEVEAYALLDLPRAATLDEAGLVLDRLDAIFPQALRGAA